jgi:hypothetical protein
MSYSTIDKEAQPLVSEEPSYSKKALAGAVAIAFVIGAAAATATSSVSVSTSTYLKAGGAKNGWKGGVGQTYAFAVYDSDETWSKCQSICKASIVANLKTREKTFPQYPLILQFSPTQSQTSKFLPSTCSVIQAAQPCA